MDGLHEYVIALIIGIVEGLTEYIPVSSTGHMVIVGDFLHFTGEKASTFEVFIQLGAILSVLLVYKERFISMLRRENWIRQDRLSLLHIAVGMLPAMGIGYLIHGFIKQHLFSWSAVVVGLVVGGLYMLLAEKIKRPIKVKSVDQITIKQAFLIGCFQVLSLWPGFSRSGSTIGGALFLGISRKAGADFSFIMAVPIMMIACIYDFLKVANKLNSSDFVMFGIGFLSAFVVAYVSIIWFLRFLNGSSLASFAYYRFILAAVATSYFLFN